MDTSTYASVNWQPAPIVTACNTANGMRAQAYSPSGIQVTLADGSGRTITGAATANPLWQRALKPSDNLIPQWD